jgi:hypothetical protein
MSSPRVARLRNALSIFTSSARVAFATAFLETRAALLPGSDPDQAARAVTDAATLRSLALALSSAISSERKVNSVHALPRTRMILDQLSTVAGPGPAAPGQVFSPECVRQSPGILQPFEHSTHMCLASMCAGWDIGESALMWVRVQNGTFTPLVAPSSPALALPSPHPATGPLPRYAPSLARTAKLPFASMFPSAK